MHLLSGDYTESVSAPGSTDAPAAVQTADKAPVDSNRLAHLEDQVAALRTEVAELRNLLAAFQKQFQ